MNDRTARLLRDANDPLLWPLIDASAEEARRRRILDEILATHVKPVVERILGRHVQADRAIRAEDAEDIMAAVQLRLVRRLQDVPHDAEAAVERLSDFTATLTYNAISDFLRKRYPERTRLKNRIRHAIARDARMAMWPSAGGIACGLASMRDIPVGGPFAIDIETPSPAMLDRQQLPEAVHALITEAGRPVLVDDVVRALVTLWHVSDAPPPSAAEANVAATQHAQLQNRNFLERLWEEILELKPMHRAALLLNLREEESGNAIALLVMLGIATVDDVAEALEMTTEQLAELWNNLPLDDRAIASMLGIDRQQVINLRRTARERLSRRLGNQ